MKPIRLRPSALGIERLEDRAVPAVWGNAWADPGQMTISFAPDGTDVNGAKSQLFQELGGLGTSTWQSEVLRAFQTWAVHANVNIGSEIFGRGPQKTSQSCRLLSVRSAGR